MPEAPKILFSQPFDTEDGVRAINFYREGIGFGILRQRVTDINESALVTFYDRDFTVPEPLSVIVKGEYMIDNISTADLDNPDAALYLATKAINQGLYPSRRQILSGNYDGRWLSTHRVSEMLCDDPMFQLSKDHVYPFPS